MQPRWHRHYGQEILSTILQEPVSSPTVETLYLKMYQDFVEAFDGIDNGISQYVSSEPPRYRSRTDISSRVGALNPRWNEPSNDDVLLERFERASEMAGTEFKERLDYLAKAWLPARDIVKRAVEKRKDVHPSGKVLIFDEFAPWKVRRPVRTGVSLSQSSLPVAFYGTLFLEHHQADALVPPLYPSSHLARRNTSTSSSKTSRSPRPSCLCTLCTPNRKSPTRSGASMPSPSRPNRSRAGKPSPRREFAFLSPAWARLKGCRYCCGYSIKAGSLTVSFSQLARSSRRCALSACGH